MRHKLMGLVLAMVGSALLGALSGCDADEIAGSEAAKILLPRVRHFGRVHEQSCVQDNSVTVYESQATAEETYQSEDSHDGGAMGGS